MTPQRGLTQVVGGISYLVGSGVSSPRQDGG